MSRLSERIGSWYIGVGATIGVGVFVIAVIGARASRSTTTIFAAILAGVVQPLPMVALGLAMKKRKAWAPFAAVGFPVLAYLGLRSLQALPLPGPDDFVNAFVHQVVGLQVFHLPAALLLAGFVLWGIVTDRLGDDGVIAAQPVHDANPPSRWQNIARWYLVLGGVVGAPLFLLLLVGTQAARSTPEMLLGVLLAVLQILPMLALAWTIEKWRRGATWMAIAYPMVVGIGGLVLRTLPQPHRDDPLAYSAAYNLMYGQLYYLPFAAILAVVVLRAVVVEQRQP